MFNRSQLLRVSLIGALSAFVVGAGAADSNPSPATPRRAQPQGKIEFSDRSDTLVIPKRGVRAEDIQGPVRSQSGSAAPEIPFTPPTATAPTYDLKKVQEYLDKEKNWMFASPEDDRDPTVEEAFGVKDAGKFREEKYTSRLERFLTEGADGKKGALDNKDTDREGRDELDLEDNSSGLGSDFSLRFLLNQERANLSAVDNAGDKRGRDFLSNPYPAGTLRSAFSREDETTRAGGRAFEAKPTDYSRMLGTGTEPALNSIDGPGAGASERSPFTSALPRGATKNIDSLIESTREPMTAPVNLRPSAVDSIGGFGGGAAARATMAPPVIVERARPEAKPAVLPIPRRNTF